MREPDRTRAWLRRDGPEGRSRRIVVLSAALCLALGACQAGGPSRGELGTLLQPEPSSQRPTVAPLPGSPLSALPTGGAVSGGIAASELADALSADDMRKAVETEFGALEGAAAGSHNPWRGAGTGVSGIVIPGERYEIGRSQCRDYSHTVIVGGQTQQLRGTACRQANGEWRSVKT